MHPDKAISAIQNLLVDPGTLQNEVSFIEWRSKAISTLKAALGANSDHVKNFIKSTQIRHEGYTLAKGINRDLEAWRGDAASRGMAELKATIFTLENLRHESPLDEAAIDPELWAHVQNLIANNDWIKVPAAVAIFLEDKVRKWAGDPKDRNGNALVGKNLYARALNRDGELRLGRQESESEGWLALGTGLALAISNVDRHRIQQRADLKRYAMGVLGLGSLLLTQLRYEHPARILEAESIEGDDAASV